MKILNLYLASLLLIGLMFQAKAGDLSASVTHSSSGMATGAIDLTISGGQAPYQISWVGPGSFTSTMEDLSGLAGGTYTVTVTDNFCGQATMTYVINDWALGIEDPSPIQALQIFPNPFEENISFEFDGTTNGEMEYRLLDVSGKLIQGSSIEMEVGKNKVQIETKNVPSGIFILALYLEDKLLTEQKVVKP